MSLIDGRVRNPLLRHRYLDLYPYTIVAEDQANPCPSMGASLASDDIEN